MSFEEVWKWLQSQIGELKKIYKIILNGIWQDQAYEEIARSNNYHIGSIRNAASKLFKLIETGLDLNVNRNTVKQLLKEKMQASAIQPADITEVPATTQSFLTEHSPQQQWEDTPIMSTNLFNDKGCIQDPDRFFDREPILHELLSGLSRGINYSLVGETQIGKSSILWRICHHIGSEALNLERDHFIYLDMQTIHDENQFFNELCDLLNIDPPCRGFELKRRLRGQRYILCLDEIEKMTDRNNFSGNEQTELRGLSDGTTTPFSLVIASRTPLFQLFPDSSERTSPLYNICHQIRVTPFSDRIARDFIEHRLQDTGVTFTEDQINELINRSQGNPARLQEYAARLYYQLTQE